ncbi:MAG: glycosyltransferase family 2 protein [candidate division Zixibacteria bacterium]|nr:glycosyltransferase family 2 protein [candidate division Zixibacteria bacterium]
MSAQNVSVSVIIVTHNSSATIGDCLRALPAACPGLAFEIIVVDNDSRDDTATIVSAIDPKAHQLRQTRNLGFGAACNVGAQSAGGTYLLFLNPDAILDAGAVRSLVDVCANTANAGFVVPRLRYPDGRFQPSCRKLPTIGNMIFSRGSVIARLFFLADTSQSARYTLPDFAQTTEVEAVAGTVALIDRSTFLSAGGFDQRFFLYMEDTDLSLRLSRQGLKHLFVPVAGAVHRWGRGSAAGKVTRIWRHHFSVWQYFLKHYPNGFSVVLLPLLLFMNGFAAVIMPDRRTDA